MYKLTYSKKAVKDINSLDIVGKKRLKLLLEDLSAAPLKKSKKLVNHAMGDYRARFGNHRVIFDIHEEKSEILILRIQHRRDVYRKQ